MSFDNEIAARLYPDEELLGRSTGSRAAILTRILSIPLLILAVGTPILGSWITAVTSLGGVASGIEDGGFFSGLTSVVMWITVYIPIILLLAGWAVIAIRAVATSRTNIVYLTDRRLILQSGEEEVIVPLSELCDIFVEASIWGKMFSYGNLSVRGARAVLTVKRIQDPEDWRTKIFQAAERHERRNSPAYYYEGRTSF